MRIIEIEALENGAHRNQSADWITAETCPEGWAIIPDEMECENFPFGTVEVEDGTVTSWTPTDIPSDPEPSAVERREIAYNTEPVIEWDGGMITVTAAAQLWQYYAAEGSPIAEQLTTLIAAAKAEIRERIHD